MIDSEARPGARPAFTLMEVLVAIIIVAVLAAAVTPTVMSRLAASRASALVTEIAGLNTGLQAFRKDVGSYPRFLSYLATMPASNAQTYCSSGATFFLGPQIAAWEGPYTTRAISGNYTTPDGYTIEDQMTYVAAAGSVPSYLSIKINAVPSDVAADVETLIDGPPGDLTAGMFQWSVVTTNATYFIPVPTC